MKFDPRLERWFCEQVAAKRYPLYVYGPTGTGKTCFAASRYLIYQKDAICKGTARFIRCGTLIRDIQRARSEGHVTVHRGEHTTEYTEQGLIRAYTEADVVILDEAGADTMTAQQREILLTILDGRRGKFTLLTSNLSVSELSAASGEVDGKERLASRLSAGARFKLDGADRRLPTTPRQPR